MIVSSALSCIAGILISKCWSWKRSFAFFVLSLEIAACLQTLTISFVVNTASIVVLLDLVNFLHLSSCDCLVLSLLVNFSIAKLMNSFSKLDLGQSCDVAGSCGNIPLDTFSVSQCLDLVGIGILSLLFLFHIIGLVNRLSEYYMMSTWLRNLAQWSLFIVVIVSMLALMTVAVLRREHAILWILRLLIVDDFRRLYLCGYWIALLSLFVPLAQLTTDWKWPQICVRKLFHLLVAIMFNLPLLDVNLLPFVVLAMGVALCGLVLLEACRPAAGREMTDKLPISLQPVMNYFQLFVDSR